MTIDATIDATGLLCPLPVLKLAKAMRAVPDGGQVQLVATDKAAKIDVPHYCAENNHHLIDQSQDGENYIFIVQKGKTL